MWSPTYLDDGDEANANSVKNLLDGARLSFNDIEADQLRRGCFNRENAGSFLSNFGETYSVKGDHGRHTYTRTVFGTSLAYSSYGADGGTETAGSYTGDRVCIGHPDATGPYSGPLAKVLYVNPVKVGMENGERCGAIRCMFNVHVQNVVIGNSGGQPMFCLQYFTVDENNLFPSGWFTIPITERLISPPTMMIGYTDTDEDIDFNVPIRCLITPSVLSADGQDPATRRVAGVRAMVSVYTSNAGDIISLNRWTLTAIPLHGPVT